MQVHSNSILKDYLKPEFGKHGQEFTKEGKPSRSFQISWSQLPENTKSLALILIDHDAIPVCGFSWVHWTVANIDPKLGELPENASRTLPLLQGRTSWSAPILRDSSLSKLYVQPDQDAYYGGPAPPDTDHLYTLNIYALDTLLQLQPDFLMNALLQGMKGHILEHTTLEAYYAH